MRWVSQGLHPMARGMEVEGLTAPHQIIDAIQPPHGVSVWQRPEGMKAPRRVRQIQQFTWNQMLKGLRTIEIVDEARWYLPRTTTPYPGCGRACAPLVRRICRALFSWPRARRLLGGQPARRHDPEPGLDAPGIPAAGHRRGTASRHCSLNDVEKLQPATDPGQYFPQDQQALAA